MNYRYARMVSCVCFASLALLATCSRLDWTYVQCDDGSVCPIDYTCFKAAEKRTGCTHDSLVERCQATYPEDLFEQLKDSSKENEFILLGTMFDQSDLVLGKLQSIVQFGFEQINDVGGIDGRQFGVISCDIEPDDVAKSGASYARSADVAAEVAPYLARRYGVKAIVGAGSSSATKAAFEALQDLDGDIPLMVSPSASSPLLTELESAFASDAAPGMLWRAAPADEYQGKAIAHAMGCRSEGAAGKVAVIYVKDDPYGQGLFEVVAASYEGEGVEAFTFGQTREIDMLVGALGSREHEQVLFISVQNSDIREFLEAVSTRRDSFATKKIFLTEMAATDAALATIAPFVRENLLGSRPTPPDLYSGLSTYRAFLDSYAEAHGEYLIDEIFTANAYDAAWLVVYGAAWAVLAEGERDVAALSSKTMARGLRELSDPEGKSIDVGPDAWPTLVEEFRAGRPVNISGASGELDYDPDTEELATSIQIWNLDENNNIDPVYTWPEEPDPACVGAASTLRPHI